MKKLKFLIALVLGTLIKADEFVGDRYEYDYQKLIRILKLRVDKLKNEEDRRLRQSIEDSVPENKATTSKRTTLSSSQCAEGFSWSRAHNYTNDLCSAYNRTPCGRRCLASSTVKRIIGGTNAKHNEFPWHASIFERNLNNQLTYKCGGVLIRNDVVLTAGHCIPHEGNGGTWRNAAESSEFRNLRIYIGLKDLRTREHLTSHTIRKYIISADYERRNSGYFLPGDYAMVKLKPPSNVMPACIFEHNATSYEELTCYAIGHGVTSKTADQTSTPSVLLRKQSNLKLLNGNACIEAQSEVVQRFDININDYLCVTINQKGKQTPACYFDSGSPVVCSRSNDPHSTFFVAGILSTIISSCSSGYAVMVNFHPRQGSGRPFAWMNLKLCE